MLNLAFWFSGTIITDLLQYAMKEEGVNNNLKNIYAEGKILRGEMSEGNKRVTSRLIFKAYQIGLDSDLLNLQEQKERIVFDTRELSRFKAVLEYTMRKAAALEIISMNKPITSLGVK